MRKILTVIIIACLAIMNSCMMQQSMDLKVMSYNIRHGKGLDNKLDVSRSLDIIKAQSPDLAGLQEVDNICRRSGGIDQTAYLADQTAMKGTFGKFMPFDGGGYGMATLSAKPLVSSKLLSLPQGLHEPRIAIVHEVELAEGCTIVFANVHFDWIEGEEGSAKRLSQARQLMEYINTLNKAAVVTGDFNCTPDSPTMKYFASQGFVFVDKGDDKLSYQGEEAMEIDHVIYRNTDKVRFKTQSIQLLHEPVVSDHRPLVAELKVIY
ncbi:endonuclease/exonuclease/phosphatase family protein [Carboxylicivirga sp. RSCT41]|uniref:endonuclease/exonuclease/phosphatase family protein n=1 Tax=Carboxylicivirga agarovorans TaxID=3417570 RepID=UPI003D339804